MPVLAFHWDLGKNLRLFRDDGGDGADARLPILMTLMSYANTRLRCWPSRDTIMRATGYKSKNTVAGAMQWLVDHGAIYRVPFERRAEQEAHLSKKKHVYQLTGIMYLGSQTWPYILLNPEEREDLVRELEYLGATYAVDLYRHGEPVSQGNHASGMVTIPDIGMEDVPDYGMATSTQSSSLSSSTKIEDPIGRRRNERPSVEEIGAKTFGLTVTENEQLGQRLALMGYSSDYSGDEFYFAGKLRPIEEHEMVQLFMAHAFLDRVTKEQTHLFIDPIILEKETGREVIFGGLVKQWDQNPHFREFVRARLAEFKVERWDTTPANKLRNLRNFDKNVGMVGFYEWAKHNPQSNKPGVTMGQEPNMDDRREWLLE